MNIQAGLGPELVSTSASEARTHETSTNTHVSASRHVAHSKGPPRLLCPRITTSDERLEDGAEATVDAQLQQGNVQDQ